MKKKLKIGLMTFLLSFMLLANSTVFAYTSSVRSGSFSSSYSRPSISTSTRSTSISSGSGFKSGSFSTTKPSTSTTTTTKPSTSTSTYKSSSTTTKPSTSTYSTGSSSYTKPSSSTTYHYYYDSGSSFWQNMFLFHMLTDDNDHSSTVANSNVGTGTGTSIGYIIFNIFSTLVLISIIVAGIYFIRKWFKRRY